MGVRFREGGPKIAKTDKVHYSGIFFLTSPLIVLCPEQSLTSVKSIFDVKTPKKTDALLYITKSKVLWYLGFK